MKRENKQNLFYYWKSGIREYFVLALFLGIIILPLLLFPLLLVFIASTMKSALLTAIRALLVFIGFFTYLPYALGRFFNSRFENHRTLEETFKRFFSFSDEKRQEYDLNQ